jgi:hypothetical protein
MFLVSSRTILGDKHGAVLGDVVEGRDAGRVVIADVQQQRWPVLAQSAPRDMPGAGQRVKPEAL